MFVWFLFLETGSLIAQAETELSYVTQDDLVPTILLLCLPGARMTGMPTTPVFMWSWILKPGLHVC